MSRLKENTTSQSSKADFQLVLHLLKKHEPFSYIRFSDGEMEVLRNERLFIGDGIVSWRKGTTSHPYPNFDRKDFDPRRDLEVRKDLIESAKYQAPKFYKGVPSSHNDAVSDRDMMIEHNGKSPLNLTFSDLLINQNFYGFRRKILPIFKTFKNVYFVGNFRANPAKFDSSWTHLQIQDDFFREYPIILKATMKKLVEIPSGSLVLLSASSLSNILGYKLHQIRQDVTLLDIGTSMHDLVGMEAGIREYHDLLLPNNFKGILKKSRLMSRQNFRLRW